MASITLHEIDDRLYTRGHYGHVPEKQKIAALRERYIHVVVNLWSKPDPSEEFKRSFVYVHSPISDGSKVDPTILGLADEIFTLLMNGAGVVINCHRGRNRAPFLAALVLMKRHGIDGVEALRWVEEKRPNSMSNHAFREFLENLHYVHSGPNGLELYR